DGAHRHRAGVGQDPRLSDSPAKSDRRVGPCAGWLTTISSSNLAGAHRFYAAVRPFASLGAYSPLSSHLAGEPRLRYFISPLNTLKMGKQLFMASVKNHIESILYFEGIAEDELNDITERSILRTYAMG